MKYGTRLLLASVMMTLLSFSVTAADLMKLVPAKSMFLGELTNAADATAKSERFLENNREFLQFLNLDAVLGWDKMLRDAGLDEKSTLIFHQVRRL